MKRIVVLLLCIVILATLALPISAQSVGEKVFDNASLLTAAEEREIADAIASAEGQSDCIFYFATYTEAAVRAAGGRSYLGERFLKMNGLSDRDDIVILTVYRDGYTYYYDMFYYGEAPSRINDKEVNYILDYPAVYDNIKGGNLSDGAESFFALSAKAYKGRVGISYLLIGTISLIIGALIGGAACLGVWKSYKRKKRPVEYPLDRYAKMELTAQSDQFTGSFVTRRVIQSSSGGRSGGGGGGGHAGGR